MRSEVELTHFIINHTRAYWEHTAELWIQRSQSAVFLKIFGFFTTKAGKKLLMEKKLFLHMPLQVFVFPIAAALEVAEAAAAFKLLYSAKNRNLGKTLDALKKLQKASLITTAIGLSTAAVITGSMSLAAVVPILFITAIGAHTLYSLGQFVKNVYQYFTTPKGSALREIYRKRMIETGIRSGVGLVLTAAIAVLFVLAVSTPLGLALMAGATVAVIIAGVITGVVMSRRAKKRSAKAAAERAKLPSEGKTQLNQYSDEIQRALAENATDEDIFNATVAGARDHQSDYYYVRNLPRLLDAAFAVGGEAKLNEIFIKIINCKIELLKLDIEKHSKDAFFRGNIRRQQKVDGLGELKNFIEGNTKDTLDVIINKYPKIFQSFFREKGDVEAIFDAAHKYCAGRKRTEIAHQPDVANVEVEVVTRGGLLAAVTGGVVDADEDHSERHDASF